MISRGDTVLRQIELIPNLFNKAGLICLQFTSQLLIIKHILDSHQIFILHAITFLLKLT